MSAATCSFPSIAAAVDTTIAIIQMGVPIARCELLDANAIRGVNKHSNLSLREAPMLLMEFHGSPAGVQEQAEAVERLVDTRQRLQSRIDAMYLDKLDGRITADFFDAKSAEWRSQQDRCVADIQRLQNTDRTYIEDGIRILELAKNARNLFDRQGAAEKRKLLDFVVSNSTWRDGKLASTYRQPFDLIAETALRSNGVEAEQGLEIAKSEIWLGD